MPTPVTLTPPDARYPPVSAADTKSEAPEPSPGPAPPVVLGTGLVDAAVLPAVADPPNDPAKETAPKIGHALLAFINRAAPNRSREGLLLGALPVAAATALLLCCIGTPPFRAFAGCYLLTLVLFFYGFDCPECLGV